MALVDHGLRVPILGTIRKSRLRPSGEGASPSRSRCFWRSADARTQRGQDIFGQPVWDTGSFPINPELLQEMAETTGGEHFTVSDREGLERSFHAILDRLERTEIEDAGRVYGELFPAFLWPALALLILELLLGSLVLRRWP